MVLIPYHGKPWWYHGRCTISYGHLDIMQNKIKFYMLSVLLTTLLNVCGFPFKFYCLCASQTSGCPFIRIRRHGAHGGLSQNVITSTSTLIQGYWVSHKVRSWMGGGEKKNQRGEQSPLGIFCPSNSRSGLTIAIMVFISHGGRGIEDCTEPAYWCNLAK